MDDASTILFIALWNIIWGALSWAAEHWQVLLMIFAAYALANILGQIHHMLTLILAKLDEDE